MLHLSQNIKLIRGLAGKTQPEFAKIIGEKLSNLKTYENTPTKPKLHVQKRIAEIANVSIKDLREKDLSEKDIKLKVGKDENVTTATETPQNGHQDKPNELKQLLRLIQFKTGKTIEQIASDIEYARSYLTSEANKGENPILIQVLQEKYKDFISDKLTTATTKPNYGLTPTNGSSTKDAVIHSQQETVKTLADTSKSQQETISKLTDLVTKLVKS